MFSYISQHHHSPTGTHSCLLTPLNTACSHTHSRERERELIQTSQTDWERYRWSCCSRTTNVFSYISQHHLSPTGTHSCLLTPLNTACSHTHSRERERERVNTDVTDRLREIQMELLLKNNQCVLLHLTTSSLSYRNTLLPANTIKHGLLPYTQQRERERELIQTSQTDWERYRWSCCSRTTNVFSYISQHHLSPTGTHSCLLTPLNTACSHTHSRERERES